MPLPSFSPESSAAKAMELHDANGDGFLDEQELDSAPGIKASLPNTDTDKDKRVSEEEIAERIRSWQQMRVGLMSVQCAVYLDKQPLAGATVTFEPEPCMEGAIYAAEAVTGGAGTARPKVPKENRPSPDSPPGMQAGFYLVKVSKLEGGTETIPAKYNTNTILGQQIAPDDYAIANRRVIFSLESE